MKITGQYGLISVILLMLAGVFASTTAFAVDVKTYPGLSCQEVTGSQATDFSRYSPYIRNNATSSRLVVCPIVRDNSTTLIGTAAAYTNVRVYNAGGTLWCYLDSSSPTGLVNWDFKSTTTVGYVTLPNDLNVSVADGYFNLYCSLPPSSRINGYKIGDWTSTDSNN